MESLAIAVVLLIGGGIVAGIAHQFGVDIYERIKHVPNPVRPWHRRSVRRLLHTKQDAEPPVLVYTIDEDGELTIASDTAETRAAAERGIAKGRKMLGL